MRTQDYADMFELEDELWWFAGMRQMTAELLDPFLPETKSRKVLDAGCGTGANVTWLKRYAGSEEVTGLDLVSDAVKFCRRRGQRLVLQGSATALPFADSSFDLVTSFDVIVQIPEEGADREAVSEMFRVLKPGGIAFVRVAAYEWMRSGHDAALETHRRYRLSELRGLLTNAHFQVRRATYANSLLLPTAAVHRLILKPMGLTQSGSDVARLPSGLRWLNPILQGLLLTEAEWLKRSRLPLPAGLSAICVAQKPYDS